MPLKAEAIDELPPGQSMRWPDDGRQRMTICCALGSLARIVSPWEKSRGGDGCRCVIAVPCA